MRKITSCFLTILLLFVTLPLHAKSTLPPDTKSEKKIPQFPVDKLLGEYSQKNAKDILTHIDNKSDRTYSDFMDMGAIYMFEGNYSEAILKFESAARKGKDAEVAKALYLKAISLQFFKKVNLSLETIDLAARISPDDVEIARMRSLMYSKSKDPAGFHSAHSHLIKNDPNIRGVEVCVSGIVIVIIVVSSLITTYFVIATCLVPPKDRLKLAECYSNTIKEAPANAANAVSMVFSEVVL